MKKIIFLIFISLNAFADQWFCTDESSVRNDTIIKSCGIGEDKEEGMARLKAFSNARKEFKQICNANSDCVQHYIYSTPLRTECRKEDEAYKCYRMVQFRIGAVYKKRVKPASRKVLFQLAGAEEDLR